MLPPTVDIWCYCLSSSCCRKMQRKWLQTHSRRPLWSEWWTREREKMQRGHRMKCMWGYRWGMTTLLPPRSFGYVEERGEIICVLQTMDNSAAMPSLVNRQRRHVGSILAKCQKDTTEDGIRLNWIYRQAETVNMLLCLAGLRTIWTILDPGSITTNAFLSPPRLSE